MTTAANEDAGTDLKSEISLQRRNIITMMNKCGLYGVCFFAPVSFICTAIWFGRCDLLDLVWGGLGIHIFLMAGAFLLLGPMAAIAYRLLYGVFGVSYKTAKSVHGILQLTSCILGIIGVRAVYVAHDDSALAYFETGSYYVYHFRSSHSIVGIFAMSIYIAHLVTSVYVFYFASKELAKSYHQLHMAVGQGLVVAMLYVAALGTLYLESEAFNEGWDTVGVQGYYRPYMTVAQYAIVMLMFSAVLVFHAQILL